MKSGEKLDLFYLKNKQITPCHTTSNTFLESFKSMGDYHYSKYVISILIGCLRGLSLKVSQYVLYMGN